MHNIFFLQIKAKNNTYKNDIFYIFIDSINIKKLTL